MDRTLPCYIHAGTKERSILRSTQLFRTNFTSETYLTLTRNNALYFNLTANKHMAEVTTSTTRQQIPAQRTDIFTKMELAKLKINTLFSSLAEECALALNSADYV